MSRETQVSITVIRRLPNYYRYLGDLLQKGVSRISSQELSKLTGFTASQIRQDLNNFGGFGQQGYGYNVEELHKELGRILGLDRGYNVVVTGAGNLGHAIANYRGFKDAGFNIIGVFDRNPDNPRFAMRNLEVSHIDGLEDFLKEHNVDIGIITTSKEIAQDVADVYVRNGVKGIWNFATIDLVVPDDVVLETVRLSESLFTLSYFIKEL
ncbi:MAG: redox-sensing transcriptional repressor Rex [Tissierellaceae bacterium]|jgi:redox-sensing transcriptional repressor